MPHLVHSLTMFSPQLRQNLGDAVFWWPHLGHCIGLDSVMVAGDLR